MINLDHFKENYGDDPELIEEVLAELVMKLQEVVMNYPNWFKENNYTMCTEHAHKMKSSLGYIGQTEGSELFKELEQKSKSDQISDMLIEEVTRFASELIIEIKKS